MRCRVLPFTPTSQTGRRPRVGRLHSDGSISFAGVTYRSIKEVPADCLCIRPDVETYRQWKRLYRAIDPKRRARSAGRSSS
jgi:hypothetical protein